MFAYLTYRFDIAGKNMVAMFVQGCIFFFLVIMIEYNFFYRHKPTAKARRSDDLLDDDVLAEEEAVLSGMGVQMIDGYRRWVFVGGLFVIG